jgi:hypothetical protein
MKVKNIKSRKKTFGVFLGTLVSLTCFVNIALAQQQLGGPPYGGPGGGGQTGPPNGGGGYPSGGPQWKVEYIKDGTVSTGGTPWSWQYWALDPFGFPFLFDQPMGGYTIIHAGNPNGSVSSSGTVTAKYRWLNPDGSPGLNPPDHIYILENSSASWSKPYSYEGSGSASNGFTPEEPTAGLSFMGGRSSGQRMKRLNVSQDGVAEYKSDQLKTSSTARYTPGSGGAGGIGAAVGFDAPISPHSVIIRCELMEEGGNWRKGSNGQPVQNIRSSSGHMTVDSVVRSHFYTDGNLEARNTLLALPTGFPSQFPFDANVSVTWEGGSNNDQVNDIIGSNKWSIGLLTQRPQSNLSPSNVKVEIKDFQYDLNVKESNTFTIKWHKPVENWQSLGVSRSAPELYGFSTPVEASGYASVRVEARAVSWFTAGDAGTLIAGAAGPASVGVLVLAPGALGLSVTADALLNLAGWLVGRGEPEPPRDVPIQATSSAFNISVGEQSLIRYHTQGAVEFPGIPRFPGISENFWNALFANPGAYFAQPGNVASGSCAAGRRRSDKNFKGDSYAVNGYKGEIQGRVNVPDDFFYIWQWTFPNSGILPPEG